MSMIIVIQARLNSERLPRKVLLPMMGHTVLKYIYRQAEETEIHTVVVTPDYEIEQYCIAFGLNVFKTEYEKRNVWAEFMDASVRYDHIVRLTADCPMITTDHINAAVRSYYGEYIYIGPDGMDVEIFPRQFLMVKGIFGDEHVTTGLYSHIRSLDTQEDYDFICKQMTTDYSG